MWQVLSGGGWVWHLVTRKALPKGQRQVAPHSPFSHSGDGGFPPPFWLGALMTVRRLCPFLVSQIPLWPSERNSYMVGSPHPALARHTHMRACCPPFPGPRFQGSPFSSGLTYKNKRPTSLASNVSCPQVVCMRPLWVVTFHTLWGSICQALQSDFQRDSLREHWFPLEGETLPPRWKSALLKDLFCGR